MAASFHLFGIVHLAILAAVPLLAVLLAVVQRRLLTGSRAVRVALALLLFLCTILYYGRYAMLGEPMFPGHLPLELCDVSLWLVILALLTLKPTIFDVAYYFALAGASMSLLTPNLTEPSLFLSVQFFVDHGLLVTAILYLVWSRQARPLPGSVGRAMLVFNILIVLIGTFDFIFKTNYMFLRTKPETVSLLTFLGPWPWYILAGDGVAFTLFLLLYLPFRRTSAKAA
jgi:hypothetical integral membrane protein (TIGR02206 family)